MLRIQTHTHTYIYTDGHIFGLPWWLSGKEFTCQYRRLGFSPRVGKIPGKGNENPRLYSYLENPMDRGAWQATVHRSQKVGQDLQLNDNCMCNTYLYTYTVRLKLKKVGKTTRPFRYDLSQIPYNYTVEVRNRFKGLDLIDRVSNELWTEVHDIVQDSGIKTIPMEKKCKKAK